MAAKSIENNKIDKFIATYPENIQALLKQIREVIKKAAPESEETINYGIPTFVLNGNLVHFSGYRSHIGFYPGASGIKNFQKEISKFKSAKGSVQFPIDQPLPISLITKIVKFRVKENNEKALAKNKRICKKGHVFYKSSTCLVCPICEKENKSEVNFTSSLSAPARRAIENKGIKTLKQLSKYSVTQISELHGIGPSSIPKLKLALKKAGLTFKED